MINGSGRQAAGAIHKLGVMRRTKHEPDVFSGVD